MKVLLPPGGPNRDNLARVEATLKDLAESVSADDSLWLDVLTYIIQKDRGGVVHADLERRVLGFLAAAIVDKAPSIHRNAAKRRQQFAVARYIVLRSNNAMPKEQAKHEAAEHFGLDQGTLRKAVERSGKLDAELRVSASETFTPPQK